MTRALFQLKFEFRIPINSLIWSIQYNLRFDAWDYIGFSTSYNFVKFLSCTEKNNNEVEQHCQHLIIQMNALIKNLSAELLKFNQEDFEKLRQAAVLKYDELAVKGWMGQTVTFCANQLKFHKNKPIKINILNECYLT